MFKKSSLAAALLCLASGVAQAITVNGDFVNTANDHWTAQFSITNDGSLPEVSNFTVYFDWLFASNLQLLASPGTWDTIVIQPDTALASSGFMDALVLDPADALLPGQSANGFGVSFDWDSANRAPRSFEFTVNDANFKVLTSGGTVVSTTAVPEPSTYLLFALGIAGIGAFVRRCSATR